MKKFQSSKWILVLVFFLLLTNIILALLLFNKGNRNASTEPYLVRHMKGLSESQKEMLRRKKEQFIERYKLKSDAINTLKDSLYIHLGDEKLGDSIVHHYISRWNDIYAESDFELIHHFREMRADFSREQQVAYDTLVRKMVLKRR